MGSTPEFRLGGGRVSAPGRGTSCLVKPPSLLNGAHARLSCCPSHIRWNQTNSQAVEPEAPELPRTSCSWLLLPAQLSPMNPQPPGWALRVAAASHPREPPVRLIPPPPWRAQHPCGNASVSQQGDLPSLKCLLGRFLQQHLSLLLLVSGTLLWDVGCSGCSLPASCQNCPSRGTNKTQRSQLEN